MGFKIKRHAPSAAASRHTHSARREPRAVLVARNSAEKPHALVQNKRHFFLLNSTSATLAARRPAGRREQQQKPHHPDASLPSPSHRLVVSYRRGCGEGGVGHMGWVQRQETPAEYGIGGGKAPPTQGRRRRDDTPEHRVRVFRRHELQSMILMADEQSALHPARARRGAARLVHARQIRVSINTKNWFGASSLPGFIEPLPDIPPDPHDRSKRRTMAS